MSAAAIYRGLVSWNPVRFNQNQTGSQGIAAMATDHTVGFEPADRLAEDRESVRRRFWIKLKRVVAQLPFAEDLLAAILEAQQLRSRAALARQRQYIGRLMRALDPALIEQALARCGQPMQRQC